MQKVKKEPIPIQWGESGFTYLPSYYAAAKTLPQEQRYLIQDAIIEYAFTGKRKELPPMLDGYLELIIPNIENSLRNYQTGAKGGRPKKT